MSYTWIQADKGPGVKAWMDGVPFDADTIEQLKRTARLPFVFKHVAAMPDAHWGRGSTVGSVIPTRGAIVPAAVGVDIGCGMMAQRTPYRAEHLPDNLFHLRTALEAAVPHGRTNNGGKGDRGAWGDPPEIVRSAYEDGLAIEMSRVIAATPELERIESKAVSHLGTLGGGNHFLEVCVDTDGQVWVMLHSGSRYPGNAIGQHFTRQAKRQLDGWFVSLPDPDLAYIPQKSPLFESYVQALRWAQHYAWRNREIMMLLAQRVLQDTIDPHNQLTHLPPTGDIIHCHHNYAEMEHHFGQNVWITRKGAVRARKGDMGIIPGSMGACSYIVRGLGCADSFHSCSHGAGRVMSRGEAKRRFTVADHEEATRGVECRKDEKVLDETPGAYKDIDAVMAAQSDLVEIVHKLKQVVCVKG